MNVRFTPPSPINRPRSRKRLWLVLIAIVLAGLVIFVFGRQQGRAPAPDDAVRTSENTGSDTSDTPAKQPEPEPAFSLTEPTSPWVVVNKKRPLQPADFVPELTDPEVSRNQAHGSENMKVAKQMAPALEEMFTAAAQNGVKLALASGYRSYTTQRRVYDREVASNGQTEADKVSARPGYSEHQTGLGADVSPTDGRCVIQTCFGQTPEGVWVRDNAWRYGFIIRYPEGKTPVTGYSYEPWHIRYVGKELAAQMHEADILTMEEWFKLDAAADY